MDDATPAEVEGDVTVPMAPLTMDELVFGPAPCTHCGEVHPPEDDTYYPGAL